MLGAVFCSSLVPKAELYLKLEDPGFDGATRSPQQRKGGTCSCSDTISYFASREFGLKEEAGRTSFWPIRPAS